MKISATRKEALPFRKIRKVSINGMSRKRIDHCFDKYHKQLLKQSLLPELELDDIIYQMIDIWNERLGNVFDNIVIAQMNQRLKHRAEIAYTIYFKDMNDWKNYCEFIAEKYSAKKNLFCVNFSMSNAVKLILLSKSGKSNDTEILPGIYKWVNMKKDETELLKKEPKKIIPLDILKQWDIDCSGLPGAEFFQRSLIDVKYSIHRFNSL